MHPRCLSFERGDDAHQRGELAHLHALGDHAGQCHKHGDAAAGGGRANKTASEALPFAFFFFLRKQQHLLFCRECITAGNMFFLLFFPGGLKANATKVLRLPLFGGLDWDLNPWFLQREGWKASSTTKPPIQTTN